MAYKFRQGHSAASAQKRDTYGIRARSENGVNYYRIAFRLANESCPGKIGSFSFNCQPGLKMDLVTTVRDTLRLAVTRGMIKSRQSWIQLCREIRRHMATI